MRNIAIAILLIPFVVMVLWVKQGSSNEHKSASTLRGIINSVKPRAEVIREDLEGRKAAAEAANIEHLSAMDEQLSQAKHKPNVVSDIKTTLALLEGARVEIVKWNREVVPLLRSAKGLTLTSEPRYLDVVEAILNQERPRRDEIEMRAKELKSILAEVESGKASEVARPLDIYDPLTLPGLQERARKTAKSYKDGEDVIEGLLLKAFGSSPGPWPDLATAIERRRQQRAADKALGEVTR